MLPVLPTAPQSYTTYVNKFGDKVIKELYKNGTTIIKGFESNIKTPHRTIITKDAGIYYVTDVYNSQNEKIKNISSDKKRLSDANWFGISMYGKKCITGYIKNDKNVQYTKAQMNFNASVAQNSQNEIYVEVTNRNSNETNFVLSDKNNKYTFPNGLYIFPNADIDKAITPESVDTNNLNVLYNAAVQFLKFAK